MDLQYTSCYRIIKSQVLEFLKWTGHMPEHFHGRSIILQLLITLNIESSTWGTDKGCYELRAQKLKKKTSSCPCARIIRHHAIQMHGGVEV
jgi:hypothetical protein